MPEKKRKRLKMVDRVMIEDLLREGRNLNYIAEKVGVTWAAIAYEVKTYRTSDTNRFKFNTDRNLCVRQGECQIEELCGMKCKKRCAVCNSYNCNRTCAEFTSTGECPDLRKAPYVCNNCNGRFGYGCNYLYVFYDARAAEDEARWKRITARRGIDITEEKLKEMVATIKPLLRKGQSLEHIWQTHSGEFPVSPRTFYRWINLGILDIINLELPKKVKYKQRKKKLAEPPFRSTMVGKTYEDFLKLPVEEQLSVVEMDCVCGQARDEQVILTLYFRRYCFQLMILLAAKTQETVARTLDHLQMICGKETFTMHFKNILTDRGSEFLNASLLETGIDGEKRCSVYYCDAMKSGQKGGCERNHAEIRKIIPKGTSLDDFIPLEIAYVCSHVNSYIRPALGGVSPYSLASKVLPKALLDELGIEHVDPDDVILKPNLFKALGLR